MSRLYRPFQALFRSRISSRLQSGQTVRIERVRIKKGRPATRFLGTMIKFGIAYQLLLWIVSPAPELEDMAIDDHEDEPLFIPLPGTTKRHPPQPYRGHDPEWQEFVRISKDHELQRKIKHDLARIVEKIAARSPLVHMRAGKDPRLTRCWMDIDYPLRAPPVYERTGILITDDAIALATMPCDSYTVTQIQRFLWPRPMALGFWAFGKEAVKQTAHDVARYFGFASEDPDGLQTRQNPAAPPPLPPSQNPEIQRALQRLRQGTTRRPEQVDDPGSIPSSPRAQSSAPAAAPDKSLGMPEKPTVDQSNRGPSKEKGFTEELIESFSSSEPWKRLKETYQREQRLIKLDPPRGSILVTGIIELQTERAIIFLDVASWYNPKTKSYALETTTVSVRRIRPKYAVAPLR
ncbi:hypothetical protein VTH82DRAFT_6019 [Thermothelomyces myriococcoides]